MSLRPHQYRQITCEVCGRRCHAEQKGRDICRTCLRKEPSIRCAHCGRMKHLVSEATGLCPSCARTAKRPQAVCARCSRLNSIYNEKKQLCYECTQAVRRYARNQNKRVKVRCSVCGEMRSSELLGRAICKACWKEERNGRGICSVCNRFKLIYVKDDRLCFRCFQDRLAPKELRDYLANYTTPYPFNQTVFDLLTSAIDWEAVTEKIRCKFRVFGQFLQLQPLDEPITWESIERALPPLGPTKRTDPKWIRSCLLDLGYLLASKGQLETREVYIARRHALAPIYRAPQHSQALLHRYVAWLEERQTAPNNVYEHTRMLAAFWSWCDQHGVRNPEEVQEALVNEYLLTLYWQWQCSVCQGITPFDPRKRKTPGSCTRCGAIGSLAKVKRYAQNTVRGHRAKLLVFFDWAKINRLVVTNPVQRQIAAPCPTIRHYPIETIKELCRYVFSPTADPVEALVLYLIIFHALSVWELRHAEIPSVLPLHNAIPRLSLGEAYYVLVPRPAPTLGDRSPGRPDIRLDFPSSAASRLRPLLERFEQQRQRHLKDTSNRYLLISSMSARRNIPVGNIFVWELVRAASQRVLGMACNPSTLRKTAGVMLADQAGAGILHWLGWDEQQAFAYAWAAREVIQPQQVGGLQGENARSSADPIIFPPPKESTRNATTKRATSTD